MYVCILDTPVKNLSLFFNAVFLNENIFLFLVILKKICYIFKKYIFIVYFRDLMNTIQIVLIHSIFKISLYFTEKASTTVIVQAMQVSLDRLSH